MGYGDHKYLARRTASDKVLNDKVFVIACNSNYDGYQIGLDSVLYKVFDKKSKGSGIRNKVFQSQQLGHIPTQKEKYQWQIISEFENVP